MSVFDSHNIQYQLGPLLDDMVFNAELLLGVKLPDSYINLLKEEQNGGVLNYHEMPFPHSKDRVLSIPFLFGIGRHEGEGILQSPFIALEHNLPSDFVFLSGMDQRWIVLDYRYTSKYPPVMFLDMENKEIHKIADSFADMIEQLSKWKKEQELRNKQYVFDDIRINVELDHENPEKSKLLIELYSHGRCRYSCTGEVFERLLPKTPPQKSIFIRDLEVLKMELKKSDSVWFGINEWENKLGVFLNRKKKHLIIQEDQRVVGYVHRVRTFWQKFHDQFIEVKSYIKQSGIMKDF